MIEPLSNTLMVLPSVNVSVIAGMRPTFQSVQESVVGFDAGTDARANDLPLGLISKNLTVKVKAH